MVHELIRRSTHSNSGFYLDDFEGLFKMLAHNEFLGEKTLVIGVTFALLDFAEKYSLRLRNTIIMETGGMKGRREELTRKEIHGKIAKSFGVREVHSEYGMTELLSQAYATSDGIFQTPPWMKIFLREMNDPGEIWGENEQKNGNTGLINVMDLANKYSCSFLATDDIGRFTSGGFEVLGRRDISDLRGCSLLTV